MNSSNLFYFFARSCVKLKARLCYAAENINADISEKQKKKNVEAKKEKDDTTKGMSVHAMLALLLVSGLRIFDTDFFLRVLLF